MMLKSRIAFTAALLSGVCVTPLTVASAQEAVDASQAEDVVVVRYQYVPDDKRVTSEVSSFLSADDFVLTFQHCGSKGRKIINTFPYKL